MHWTLSENLLKLQSKYKTVKIQLQDQKRWPNFFRPWCVNCVWLWTFSWTLKLQKSSWWQPCGHWQHGMMFTAYRILYLFIFDVVMMILDWIFSDESKYICAEHNFKTEPTGYVFYVLQQAIASSKLFLLHIVAKTKWQPFCWQHIQVHFIEWKLLWFYSNFTTICSQVFNSQYGSIGWDNGSVPYRRQTLISTNDGLVYWCILASLGLNELMNVMWYTHVYNMAKCLLILIVESW